jgi:hypothetical protein
VLLSALLKHNFIRQYKIGSNIPADYFSHFPSKQGYNSTQVAAFDPFKTDLCKTKAQFFR